jgi:hypothetical protein
MRVLELQPTLMPHQVDFVMDDVTPIQGFVGGYRAGKTEALTWKALRCAVELYPGEHGVIISPISGMNQRNVVPILRRILPKTGLEYDVDRLSNTYVDFLDIKIGRKTSRIWLNVSAENYTRMNGMSLAWGGFDEADLCRNADMAYDAFVELGNRLSEAENTIQFAVSTPEGYAFMHRRFVEQATPMTKIWHVKMTDNFLLPKGYIESRMVNIPANKRSAYINGEFANIFTATVYNCFDRTQNDTDFTAEKARGAPIFIGMDFNIEHCAAIAHVLEGQEPRAVHEFIDLYDTTAMCKAIKAKYPDRRVIVYPDASGKNRNPAGMATSHAIIKQFGFELKVNPSNPGVGDRINSMNAMFCNAMNQRRYRVNTKLCPVYTRCLERQGWKDGEPDKSNNVDHPLDAGGYYIHFNFPLQGKPTLRQYG